MINVYTCCAERCAPAAFIAISSSLSTPFFYDKY